jgi:hypothetical protein
MALTKIGKYDVLRSLGKGPSGESYLAEDRGNGHRVVIRLLEGGDSLVEQARRVAALSHPNLGLGQVGLQGGTPFFATEYFAGATLADWVSGNPPLPERLKVVEALADALAHIHEQGVVHGGLEPSAVRITDDGECKLTDFEFGTRDLPASTAYRPPEVLQGNAYTQRSEIHAAGVLFYEALAGKNPFQRGTPAATKEAVLNDQPQQLSEARKDVQRDLADAIMACFEKDPDWRPKDLSYVLEVVRRSSGSKKIAGRKTAAAPAAASARAAAPTFSGGGGRRRSSSRVPLFAALGAGAVALGAAGWFLLGPGAGGTSQNTTSAPSTTLAAPRPIETPAEAAPGAVTPAPVTPTPSPNAADSGKLAAKDPQATGRPPEPVPATASGGATKVPGAMPVPEAEARPVLPRTTAGPGTTTASATGGTIPATDGGSAAGAPVPTLPAIAQEPASLRNLAPPILKRPATTILDVHGSGLRADHQAVVFKGKEVAPGISVVRQRLVNSGLMQVVLLVDASASPGTYTIAFTDPRGTSTNPLRFDVAK